MAIEIVDTGVTLINEESDNKDVSYSTPDYLGNMNPIPDNNKSTKRYVPLVGNLFNKNKQIQQDNRYDANGNYITVFYQMNTKNKSFMEMHYYLKAKGIKNNKFHLLLYDNDLANVDPYDPLLPTFMKQKVFLECQRNFWYYVREVVRVQSQGGPYVMYKLDRGNLALNFCFTLNLNIYE